MYVKIHESESFEGYGNRVIDIEDYSWNCANIIYMSDSRTIKSRLIKEEKGLIFGSEISLLESVILKEGLQSTGNLCNSD